MSDQAWPARYEFRVDGVLDGQWADWFGGLRVKNDGSQTVIVGLLADQSALHGNDRLVYTLAGRAPWLLRLMFAKSTHDVRRDPAVIFRLMTSLGPAGQAILGHEDFRQMFTANVAEAFRQESRGPAHDYTLEARRGSTGIRWIGPRRAGCGSAQHDGDDEGPAGLYR